MGKLNKETVEELRLILHQDYCQNISFTEAKEFAASIINYFDTLSDLKSSIALHQKNYEKK